MKKYIILLMLGIGLLLFCVGPVFSAEPVCSDKTEVATAAYSQDVNTDVPKYMKGAVIIVRLGNGTESSVPAEKFKVVKRKQQYMVVKEELHTTTTCTTPSAARKNRVALLGGEGTQSGVSTTKTPTTALVENNTGFVGGAQYQRMVTETLSLGIQGQTNKTGSLLLGLDF